MRYTYIYIHAYIQASTCMHPSILIYLYIYTCKHTHIHTYIHIRTYIHVYYTYIHMCTSTHNINQKSKSSCGRFGLVGVTTYCMISGIKSWYKYMHICVVCLVMLQTWICVVCTIITFNTKRIVSWLQLSWHMYIDMICKYLICIYSSVYVCIYVHACIMYVRLYLLLLLQPSTLAFLFPLFQL